MLFPAFKGAFILSLYLLIALFCGGLFFAWGAVKLLLPHERFHALFADGFTCIGWLWAGLINLTHWLNPHIRWELQVPQGIQRSGSYLVIANHRSWLDILVFFKAFHRHIAPPRFFIKPPKRWNLMFRAICWFSDFPVMQRYSKEFLEQHPELEGQDLETTRRFCRKFKNRPFTVMNFVEGTRFTQEKHARQQSPFRHLLQPKAGGIALLLAELGDSLDGILHLTLAYPEGKVSFWNFLCGRIPHIVLCSARLPITPGLQGDYLHDPAFRARFQAWLNLLWQRKDHTLASLLNPTPEGVFPHPAAAAHAATAASDRHRLPD